MRTPARWLVPLPLLLAGPGCADPTDGEATLDDIFAVSTHTLNSAACEPGGTPVVFDDGLLIGFADVAAGPDDWTLLSCASEAACRAAVEALAAGGGGTFDFGFSVDARTDDGTYLGTGASTGFFEGAVCTGGELRETRVRLAGASLRVEVSIIPADDYPSPDGSCSTMQARAAAEGNPCTQLEVLTAGRVASL